MPLDAVQCGCGASHYAKGPAIRPIWKLLLANVRTPRQNYGDLRAMIGAVELGVRRTEGLVRKYGKEVFRQTCEDLMDYSERRMRAEITRFPDGRYPFEDVIEVTASGTDERFA